MRECQRCSGGDFRARIGVVEEFERAEVVLEWNWAWFGPAPKGGSGIGRGFGKLSVKSEERTGHMVRGAAALEWRTGTI